MFPSWPVSSPEPHASRPSAHSFSAPAGQHLPFPFTSHSGQPVNRQMLFCSFGFPDAKTRGAYLAASKTIVSGLAGQHLPPPFFSYRPPQSSISQLSSSRLGRPTPYTPSHNFYNIHKMPSSHQVSLPTILQKSTNCHLPKHPSDASPPSLYHHSVLPHIFLFLFSISPPSSRLSPFRTSIPPLSQRPPLLPSCCRFSKQQPKRET